jgi:hypothetical protein
MREQGWHLDDNAMVRVKCGKKADVAHRVPTEP